ncbi:hypothetical protein Pcinc_038942 [Petrolisthes cinctipes]|uniref:Uncharacterized protein n=1 Tax=Petrolisthes cinctipes TaxID=88211 RepID=A0AAE1BSG3_PETCI|nr:hypothetical protein Pcinc_038942 [Petrolisthes cinctipes]
MDVLSSLQPLAQMAYCDPRDQPPAVKCPLLCSMVVVGAAGLIDFLALPSPHDTPLLHSTGGSSVENLAGDIKELDLPFIMRGDILGRGKGTLSLSIEKIKRWRRSGSRAVISRPSQDGGLMSSEVGVNCHLGIRHRLE